ncbi:hypothetical protein [Alicyclobacillus sp. SO9]|uniref:hypothetical protein n=1 Tax=Alicyclobacillus sp. SO9 TaxID=2665646 RepID=UPI0018E78471|nr:hypothetical protein [Alicyclobacillus sp. SO9]QQE79577.1 hypothetical protein GI364_03520 [Alicyclobacillus sp. SO9]
MSSSDKWVFMDDSDTTLDFSWCTFRMDNLWITAIDLRGKISERTFDILLGASAGVAVLSTIFMLVVMFGNRKR